MYNSLTVPLLDIERYMGHWYELARLPIVWETGCERATAFYTLKRSKIKVINTCFLKDGSAFAQTAKAWIANPNEPGKLNIQFDDVPGVGSYYIHWTDYDRFAVVGSPDRTNLWFLGRSNQITQYELESLLRYACQMGYPTQQMIVTGEIF